VLLNFFNTELIFLEKWLVLLQFFHTALGVLNQRIRLTWRQQPFLSRKPLHNFMKDINKDYTAELMAFPLNTLDDLFLQH